MNLTEIFDNHKGHYINKFVHYLPIYETFLEKYRGKEVVLLELGIGEGGSLEMWKEYLGDKAMIYGADKHNASGHGYTCDIDAPNIKTLLFEQENPESVRKLTELPRPDIIIDDCGHYPPYQKHTFEILFPHLKDDGVYFIEDIQISYVQLHGFGWKHKDSLVEYFKDLVDSINKDFGEQRDEIPSGLGWNTKSVNFYLNMIAVEKWPHKIEGPRWSGVKGITKR